MFGNNLAAQATVREVFIANKVDGANASHRPFTHDENQIDPVLIKWFVLRFNRRREPSGLAIEFKNALHIRLHAGRGKDTAWRGLDFFAQFIIIQGAIALEQNAVDDRILDHTHDQIGARLVKARIGKKARRKQCFQRQVNPCRVKRIAR